MSETPLFDRKNQQPKVDKMIAVLRQRPRTDAELEAIFGRRFSAYKRELVKLGCKVARTPIDGGDLYEIVGHTPMVAVTDEMKSAYYETEHWATTRRERMSFDDFRCAHCRSVEVLQVHHWHYELFAEDISDLVTLCRECHERIHAYDNVQVHFPHTVTPEIAARLGVAQFTQEPQSCP